MKSTLKRSNKKSSSGYCYYCDYLTCRKGHSCSKYKEWVKSKFSKKRHDKQRIKKFDRNESIG